MRLDDLNVYHFSLCEFVHKVSNSSLIDCLLNFSQQMKYLRHTKAKNTIIFNDVVPQIP